MSEPKRYISVGIMGFGDGTYENPKGNYVCWEDYARLKAENNRLRKEGDAMYDYIMAVPGTPMAHVYLIRWNAAKDGKDAE